MRIVVIGLGSMGKRRIRLIRELFPTYEIYGIDSREDRQIEAKEIFEIKSYNGIQDVTDCVDCAFVCTSPLSHASIIRECLKMKWNVFTELNLVADDYQGNIALAKQNNCKLFLSSTFLYREETKYIKSKISCDEKWNYVYHVGQYLPDWHPWESIKDFFVGDKRTNGCREIFAIELPWLTQTFGTIKKVAVVSDKISKLNINYNDNFIIQIEHITGSKGAFIVDVVSPVAIRDFHAYKEGKYISWKGTPDSILEFDSNERKLVKVQLLEESEHINGYSNFIVENAYKNEIWEFFEVVNNNKELIYGFEQDYEILKIIDSIGA